MNSIYLELKNEKWQLEDREVKYLFSTLFRFDYKNKTNILKNNRTELEGDLLNKFKIEVHNTLIELIKDCYEEPPVKKRQKHPTFFRRFILEEKKYVVDYTTSIMGRLIYTLYLRISFIDEAVKANGKLIITVIEEEA